MSDPEIDRRCIICGASARSRALFCPQCGQPFEHQNKESEKEQDSVPPANPPPDLSRTVEIRREAIPDFSETLPLSAVSPSVSETPEKESPPPPKPPPDFSRTVEIRREAIPDFSETQPLIAVRPPTPETAHTQPLTALRNPPPVARGQEGIVKGRVEKLRKASSIVIDQAAYDPSLRFILVGAAFFLLFLFLLLLSKVLG